MIRILGILLFFISTIISSAQAPADYYSSADGKTGAELKVALHEIIDGHKEFPYTSSTTDTWDVLKISDRDPNNPANVILVYTGRSVNAAQEWNNGAGFSREHVFCKSRGDFGTSIGTGTDLHNLKPCDPSVNSTRSNKVYDEGGKEVFDEGLFTGCYTDDGRYTFEPRDEVKGDMARIIFYMAVRYEGDDGEVDLELTEQRLSKYSKKPLHGVLSTLLKWHEMDQVDDFERNRNDVIYKYQGNRNPFIDNPDFVSLIWGVE